MNFVNRDGQPIERTPLTNPYSYETYLAADYRTAQVREGEHAAYDDRMRGWYPEAWSRAAKAARQRNGGFSQADFSRNTKTENERFLSDVLGEQITLVMIERCCNVSNGYPVHYFSWNTKAEAQDV